VLAPGGLLAFQLPGEAQVLPAEVFRCRLELTSSPPAEFPAGEPTAIGVRVTNTSGRAWSLEQTFAVGNHWRRGGEVVCWDDGRGPLPLLAPGESADVELLVTAPNPPGSLELELDVVAEGIAWFSAHGAPTLSLPAVVVDGGKPSSGEAPGDEQAPRMEMHCIPSAEVTTMLEEAGLTVLQARVSNTATAWIDYWYLAQQPLPGMRRKAGARRDQVSAIRRRLRTILPLGLRRALRRLIP
jgi:hypothetical protein